MRLHRIFFIDALPSSLLERLTKVIKTSTGYDFLARGRRFKAIKGGEKAA